MNVAILTMFGNLDTTYSLVNVVAEELRMMLDAGIHVKLLVCEQFDDNSIFGIYKDKRIEWVKVTNTLNGKQIEWYDYDQPDSKVHDTFFQEAAVIAVDFATKLADVDICIMHDILYQGWHLLHNVAIRLAQENLKRIKFISFSHSAPLNRPLKPQWPFSARFTPMPQTTFISLTNAGITPLAKQYDIPEGCCSVINNSLDVFAFMGNDMKVLATSVDLLSPDVLIVYPGRLTPGKSFEKVTAFAGVIKQKSEGTVKVIFCDFPSGDIDSNLYKNTVKQNGIEFGLDKEDIIFTSDVGYPNGFPRNSVLELFSLSNLFIQPSYSEAFPLIALEAASRGNLLVVNQAVPSLQEIGKQLNAYFMRWNALNYGFSTTETYHPSERMYYEEHAENILYIMRQDPILCAKTKVRQRYNPNWVFQNQLAPLLDVSD